MATRLRLRSVAETQIQQAIVRTVRDLVPFHSDLALLFMVNNGNYTGDFRMWNWLKTMGLLPGLPDLCLPVARGSAIGRWLEIKADQDQTEGAIKRIARWAEKRVVK